MSKKKFEKDMVNNIVFRNVNLVHRRGLRNNQFIMSQRYEIQ